ncbi:MAG: NTP transferase domain-containing protein [Candidatus Riflebacteria bacterium]|nr:NTP transferase domain-containing protein [Candidatus Riflebacteria bacterium]
MKIILPVAGKGTRLRPHTLNKPKSLVRVAGKTVLEHVINSVSKVKTDEIIFITDENGGIIESFMKEHYPNLNPVYITQAERLGPAHAVWLAANRIKPGDDVLVVFNDTLFVTDLTRIPRLCEGLDGLIYSKEVLDYKRFGVNVMKDGIIVDMVEKPDQPVSKLAQVGLYYLRDGNRFMNSLAKAIDLKLTVKGEYYLPEVFKLMIAEGMKLGAPEIDEWLDCGKADTLLSTNRYLLENTSCSHYCIEGCVIIPPVAIHPSAKVNHSVIGPHVSIAEGCQIECSIIKDSVINANTILKNVILAESLIGDSVELTDGPQRINIGDNSVIDMGGGLGGNR